MSYACCQSRIMKNDGWTPVSGSTSTAKESRELTFISKGSEFLKYDRLPCETSALLKAFIRFFVLTVSGIKSIRASWEKKLKKSEYYGRVEIDKHEKYLHSIADIETKPTLRLDKHAKRH